MKHKSDYPSKYRPRRVSEVYGQKNIRRVVAKGLDEGSLPNSLMFYGPSGTGKTSMSRIIAMGLSCLKGPSSEPCGECEVCSRVIRDCLLEYEEVNAAHVTGVDSLRDMRGKFQTAPWTPAQYKIFVFDECHRLSKEAQTLLLKEVEDGLHLIYFIFCSTDPDKILITLRNRCMPFEFTRIPPCEIRQLLHDVCQKERVEYIPEVLDEIVTESDGLARNALYLLQQKVMLLT